MPAESWFALAHLACLTLFVCFHETAAGAFVCFEVRCQGSA